VVARSNFEKLMQKGSASREDYDKKSAEVGQRTLVHKSSQEDLKRLRTAFTLNKAKAQGVRFGPKPLLTTEVVQKVKHLRADGLTVPEIMRRTKLSKASIYRALGA